MGKAEALTCPPRLMRSELGITSFNSCTRHNHQDLAFPQLAQGPGCSFKTFECTM